MVGLFRLLVALMALCFLTNMIVAQEKAVSQTCNLLIEKQYQECIRVSKDELLTSSREQLEFFPRITATAIAIDKGGKWGSDDEAEIRKLLLLSTTALRYFSAMRGLLQNRIGGVELLFDGATPKATQWPEAISLLKSNGYLSAATTLESLYSMGAADSNLRRKIKVEALKDGLLQWASLSQDSRGPVARVVMKRFATDIDHRKLLSLTSLSLFFTSAQDNTVAKENASIFSK